MRRPVLVTPPEILPVSLSEAKLHLRIEPEAVLEDALIEGLISAAVSHLDGWTGILGRCLVEQVWQQDFEGFSRCMHLPLGPVISLSTVTSGEDNQPIDSDLFRLSTDAGGRPSITFTSDASFYGPIRITYLAGYRTIPAQAGPPATPEKSTVPQAIKQAILLFVGAWYENREETVMGFKEGVSSLPASVAAHALLAPYRRTRF
nr:hypothetical protein 3 [Alphaproteobacteria bacterium]BDD46015.1 hypothetical protein 4 [Pseudomonadaceae bacterium]BDD46432.1 hypothetical protein 3 [bacterium]